MNGPDARSRGSIKTVEIAKSAGGVRTRAEESG